MRKPHAVMIRERNLKLVALFSKEIIDLNYTNLYES
jgi:hypothetical protein